MDDQYTKSLGDAIYHTFNQGNVIQPESYTVGQPDSLKRGIDYLIQHQCKPSQQSCNPIQIFFAGYADDLNTLKNKLNAARENGLLTQPTIRIIGGEGFYDLGSYNIGNYANLFFTMNASYEYINPLFSASANSGDTDRIPPPPANDYTQENCLMKQQPPYNEPFNCEYRKIFNQQVYPTNIYGPELAGTHVLLTYDAVHTFLNALEHANGETETQLWQAINQHWSGVGFDGLSGRISFAQANNSSVNDSSDPNNPTAKYVYVACTDNLGHTHVVAQYNMSNDGQFLAQPDIPPGGLDACIPKTS